MTIPENNNPRNPVPVHRDNVFNQPTDVAWDSKGNSYFSDGYVNSRVGKANAKGEWVASWGSLGNGQGQFDTPHGIAVSPKDEVYVADRGNRRIQVFDTEGKYIREFTIDVPVDIKRGKITYGAEQPDAKTGSLAPGAPDALCMTPGPNPVLFVGDLYPSRIYKVSLDGKLLGVYGQPGRNLGEFGWIHAIACPSENEIWVGELINWRVQKLVTKRHRNAVGKAKRQKAKGIRQKKRAQGMPAVTRECLRCPSIPFRTCPTHVTGSKPNAAACAGSRPTIVTGCASCMRTPMSRATWAGSRARRRRTSSSRLESSTTTTSTRVSASG